MMPVNEPPLTEPLRTLTFVTVPWFWPASGPMNWLFAFAVMLTLVKSRSLTLPIVPMKGKRLRPDRLLILEIVPSPPLPVSVPVNVVPGAKPANPLALSVAGPSA